MKKNIFLSALTAVIVSTLMIMGYSVFFKEKNSVIIKELSGDTRMVYTKNNEGEIVPLDFTGAAEKVVDGVVHITAYGSVRSSSSWKRHHQGIPDSFFDDFFNPPQRNKGDDNTNKRIRKRKIGSGSGVFISDKGYIITNNHVIDKADEISVKLHDNRVYIAKVIGRDPSTDIALLQIKADDLTVIPFVDSDVVNVGEWVLAVGNPFSLTSTVTAGIVSAKARNININPNQFAVESFIQTDAAINPGNSGGALVNLEGGLIGINTAIASRTGTYNGYGFAVPSNIVAKVVEDLLTYGSVQRGMLGVSIRTVDGELALEKDLKVNQGVLIAAVGKDSAAEIAQLQAGDVIVSVDGTTIKSSPELQELIARKRPGDKVTLTVNRDGDLKDFDAILKNKEGNTDLVKKSEDDVYGRLGVQLEELSDNEKKKYSIDFGVKVASLESGLFKNSTQMREGFIITRMNGEPVESVSAFKTMVKKIAKSGSGVLLKGIYPNSPGYNYYAFGFDE